MTPSVAKTVVSGGSGVQMVLELRSVGFCGGRKTGEPGEKPSEQQTQPTRYGWYGNQTRKHLSTAPTVFFVV